MKEDILKEMVDALEAIERVIYLSVVSDEHEAWIELTDASTKAENMVLSVLKKIRESE